MKKKLLFTAYNLDMGGIEKALVNLVNRIDYDKYDVTIILEKKEGIFLNEVNKNVNIQELRVSNSKNIFVRKIINFYRKYKFKRKYQNKFDFSCAYATYSYSSIKLALLASKNNSLYIHSNYSNIYEEGDFYDFFNTRSVDKFKKLIFVSKEAEEDFLKKYPSYRSRSCVINNFINIEDIKEKSKEKISVKKEKNNLLVFVGRLENKSKRIDKQINLIENLDDIELWIIGDGEDKDSISKEISDKGLEDRIKLLGQKKNPYPYIKCADYIILTSDYEGFPVIFLEAIALNKKIITTINASDAEIDISKYGNVISKDEQEMIKEVGKILKENKEVEKINLGKVQNNRMKALEKIFNEVV